MKKIPSVFCRNYETDRLIRNEVVPGCEWVLSGEGVATPKWDGTCTLIKDGQMFRRFDAKKGKTPPADFIPAMDPDPITGHWAGWRPCVETDPACQWHWMALGDYPGHPEDGTYELCGPKVNGDPHGFGKHILVPHGGMMSWPRSFAGQRQAFFDTPVVEFPIPFPHRERVLEPFGTSFTFEGVVFHHPDGRMAKVKRKDFGLPWPVSR